MSESDPRPDGAADQSDRVKPWTIKGIPPEERNAAIAAADREGVVLGEWMRLAIRTKIKADRGAKGKGAVAARGAKAPPMDLTEMERLVALVHQMQQSTGEPPPQSVSRTLYARIRERLNSPGQTPARAGHTAAAPGQTETMQGPTDDLAGQTKGEDQA